VTIKTSAWVVAAVDGVLSNMVDLSEPAIQKKLGTTTAELTGEWAYTQAISGIAPTQVLGKQASIAGSSDSDTFQPKISLAVVRWSFLQITSRPIPRASSKSSTHMGI